MDIADQIAALRARRTADPDFRRRMLANPMTRAFANREAEALFDLCSGFVYTQVLAAFVALELPSRLAPGTATATDLATLADVPADRMEQLLDAAQSLRLARRASGGGWGLGPLGSALIDNPGVLAMVSHNTAFYRDLPDPLALLRGQAGETAMARFWTYTPDDGDGAVAAVGAYSDLMDRSQTMVAETVLAAHDFAGTRHLMDVGGGMGAFLRAVGSVHRQLKLTLFDLPAVATRASARFASDGTGPAIATVGGSFLADTLPGGADTISLVRILHDHDDADALTLLRAVHAALPPDGTLLLAEPMAAEGGRLADVYLPFYLMAMGRGRTRTPARIGQMLEEAGFAGWRRIATPLPMMTGLIRAWPKAAVRRTSL